jgi:hypothetical protein
VASRRQVTLSLDKLRIQGILQALKKVTGMGKEPIFKKHHDLDALAGRWSKEEAKAFQKNIQIFERIDEDLWK